MGLACVFTAAGLSLVPGLRGQEPPPVPKGIEVQARGPVHEAYASLTADPTPAKPIAKRPPKPLEEMPPEEKPEGDVTWIGGYWAYDDERNDFMWVSGTWRVSPPGKQWVAGYWREEGDSWQWVAGFWTTAAKDNATQEVTYLPAPPAPPEIAPPGQAPNAESFYVPGVWVWSGTQYAWRAGYWARVQPGYVWTPAHYRWTPGGYIYIAGYWDLSIKKRGILYAPIVVTDPTLVTVNYVYTPTYAVSDTIVVDSLFVRPAYCHYYFGDYYGPTYVTLGFQSGVVYSQSRYDSIVVYERYEHRSDPAWFSVQINLFSDRSRGLAPVPPRTLVQQNTIIQRNVTNVTNVTNVNNTTINNTNINKTVNNNTVLMAPSQAAAAKGMKTVPLDSTARQQAKQQATAVQQVAMQRTQTEKASPSGNPSQPRTASLRVPPTQPIGGSSNSASHPGGMSSAPSTNSNTSPGAGAAHTPASQPPSGTRPPTGVTSPPPGHSAPGSAPSGQSGPPPGTTSHPLTSPPPGGTSRTPPPGNPAVRPNYLPPGQAPRPTQPGQKPQPSHNPPPKDKDKAQ